MQMLKESAGQPRSERSPFLRLEPQDLLSIAVYVRMIDAGLEHELEHNQRISALARDEREAGLR